jgi:hypothetical protein
MSIEKLFSTDNIREFAIKYVNSMDIKTTIAYNIAKTHLGTLFSLEKSNGLFDWLNINVILIQKITRGHIVRCLYKKLLKFK